MKFFSHFFMAFTVFTLFLSCFPVNAVGTEAEKAFTVIVDAGHGGSDGGAVGLGGTAEKELNLDTAKKLAAFIELYGIPVVMTRTDDNDTDGNSASFNKKQDIHNRLSLAEQYPESFFLSIHMNYSTGTADKGFQVFYGHKNDYSITLAEEIFNAVKNSGCANRMREVKKAPSTVYLMKNISSPAVLVECGFISNEADCEKLYNENYRMKLAFILFSGVVSAAP